jgi:hypothetical protein
MSPITMLYPMLAPVLLTLGAFANLLRPRVRALREGSFYRQYSGGVEPDYAIRRHATIRICSNSPFYFIRPEWQRSRSIEQIRWRR